MFKTLESQTTGTQVKLQELLAAIPFNAEGLIPAIAQQFDSKEVLMMAWMNREALEETLNNGQVCYYSRSRQRLWRKGESSGQTQQLKQCFLDCDGDTLLLLVDQIGPACHSGRRNCFYIELQASTHSASIDQDVLIDPKDLYKS